jgi:hypothetical protein
MVANSFAHLPESNMIPSSERNPSPVSIPLPIAKVIPTNVPLSDPVAIDAPIPKPSAPVATITPFSSHGDSGVRKRIGASRVLSIGASRVLTYDRMRKMLPEGAVRQKMRTDGIHEDDINEYFSSDPVEPVSNGNFFFLLNYTLLRTLI